LSLFVHRGQKMTARALKTSRLIAQIGLRNHDKASRPALIRCVFHRAYE